MSDTKTYLSREGQVFGPYSSAQVEQMKQSGEIAKYFWLWDGTTPGWIPASPPPPLPVERELTRKIETSENLVVVCHDFRTLWRCGIEEASRAGCKLLVKTTNQATHGQFHGQSRGQAIPAITKGRKIWINILDEATGRMDSVEGTVTNLSHKGDAQWEVTVKWLAVPELIVMSNVRQIST